MVQSRRDRLPSGRHHLTREAVQASQRGRLLVAMAETVATKGYVATTVADVVERAGVSRRTFYEQFPDKEACFLAAYDTGVDVMLSRIRDAVEPLAPADWRARTRTGLQTYLEVLAAEPDFAWCFHIEVLSAGAAALARRSAVHVLFSGLWRDVHQRARDEKPDLMAWPAEGHHMLSAGLEELVRERLRSHGAGSLPAYGETMVRIVFRAFGVGDQA